MNAIILFQDRPKVARTLLAFVAGIKHSKF